jgi:hypothetical protein
MAGDALLGLGTPGLAIGGQGRTRGADEQREEGHACPGGAASPARGTRDLVPMLGPDHASCVDALGRHFPAPIAYIAPPEPASSGGRGPRRRDWAPPSLVHALTRFEKM